jgi:hypothetical protein
LYKKAKSFSEKQKLFQGVIDEENTYREMFAQDRDNAALNDPHLMLVPVHDNKDIFLYQEESPEEAKIPHVFPIDRKTPGTTCVVNPKEFSRNLDVFTESTLRFINWDNVFMAGGSVLACLSHVPEEYSKDNKTRRTYFHDTAYPSSGIHLLLTNINLTRY